MSQPTFAQSIMQSSESTSLPPSIYSSDVPDSGTGFWNTLKNINMTTWIIIVLILAFLGFNVFTYLAKETDTATSIFAPLITKIFGSAVQVVDVSAEGAKAIVNETAEVLDTGLTSVQHVASKVKGSALETTSPTTEQTPLNKALNSSSSKKQEEPDYQADAANSSIQGGGKSGWCYIGEDRGFRSCAQVGVNDSCMSGEIFPNQEICMNPTLRA
jgi:hypothetical protein